MRRLIKRSLSTDQKIFNIPEQPKSIIQEQSIRSNFDSSRFVKMLQDEGLTQVEAEGLVSLISEVVDESTSITTKSLVNKKEQTKFLEECNTELQRIRREISMIANQDFGMLKSKIDNIKTALEASNHHSRDGVSKLQAGIRLDMNLEKSRTNVEIGELKTQLVAAETKIDLQLEKLEKRLHLIKENTRKGVSRIKV
jgi:uncharacterized protein with von Willebrand factor type A (vWA) domain